MMIDRRGFLVLSAVGAAAACSSPPKAETIGDPPAASPVVVDMNPGVTDVDLGGVTVRTWTYTGTVPAKEIRVKKAGHLRAVVTNGLPKDTTVHWHGLAIPNAMDGVPVLTQSPIAPGAKFTYEFSVPDAGTYYLHSHVGTQLDRGMYGPVIIEDPDDGKDYDDELVVVLDDWIDGTGTTPDQVLENLQKTGMKPMNMDGPMTSPTNPLGDDGGDVVYPYYLINGRTTKDPQVLDYRAGQRIRLRIINAGADTAFRVAVPGADLLLTHTDGYPVVPQRTGSVILGMGERVDAIVTIGSSAPLIAAAEGKEGYALLSLRVDGSTRERRRRCVREDAANLRGAQHGNAEACTGSRSTATQSGHHIGSTAGGSAGRLQVAHQRQALRPAEQRACRRGGQTGAVALRQRVDDVSSNALARAHVPGGPARRSRATQGHRARPADEDRRGGLRHRQSRPLDRALP